MTRKKNKKKNKSNDNNKEKKFTERQREIRRRRRELLAACMNNNNNNNNNESVQATADILLYGPTAPDYKYKNKYEYDDECFEDYVNNKQERYIDPYCNYGIMIKGRRVRANRRRFRLTIENHKQLEKARGIMMTKDCRSFQFSETLNIIIGLGLEQFFLSKKKSRG